MYLDLYDYLIPLHNANTSSFRSRSTFFLDSHHYVRVAYVAFFEAITYTAAIDVAQSEDALGCEPALA